MTPRWAPLTLGVQFAIGVGLMVAPWLLAFISAMPLGWAVSLVGALLALAAAAAMLGMARPGAGASLPAGLAALGTAILPYAWSAPAVGWALLAGSAVALLNAALLFRDPFSTRGRA